MLHIDVGTLDNSHCDHPAELQKGDRIPSWANSQRKHNSVLQGCSILASMGLSILYAPMHM